LTIYLFAIFSFRSFSRFPLLSTHICKFYSRVRLFIIDWQNSHFKFRLLLLMAIFEIKLLNSFLYSFPFLFFPTPDRNSTLSLCLLIYPTPFPECRPKFLTLFYHLGAKLHFSSHFQAIFRSFLPIIHYSVPTSAFPTTF